MHTAVKRQLHVAEDAKTHIKPKKDTAWQETMEKLKPEMEKEMQRLITEVRALETKKQYGLFAVSELV